MYLLIYLSPCVRLYVPECKHYILPTMVSNGVKDVSKPFSDNYVCQNLK